MVTESEFDAMIMHKNCSGHFFTLEILLIFWNYELQFLAKTQKSEFSAIYTVICVTVRL